jgi:hypothetical protein
MATLKTLVFLQGYEGSPSAACSGNPPSKNFFKWTRESQTSISSALSETFQIAPGTTQSLFSGVVALTQDGTTQYSLALAPFQSSIYQLTNTGGTAPTFRTLRSIGTDATTQVTTSVNGPILTYTFTGGTLPSLSSVVPGDNVLIGSDFNALNQGSTGIWQIISVTSTSFSVVNPMGYVEGPITLGSGFANQIRIFSAAGVQVGDTVVISSGFSPVSWGSYQITLVTDYYLYFSYTGSLPSEGPITTEIAVYSMAKSLVYMESDQNLSITLNGILSGSQIIPQVANGSVYPGIFMQNGSVVYSLSVTNNSINVANVTLLSAE